MQPARGQPAGKPAKTVVRCSALRGTCAARAIIVTQQKFMSRRQPSSNMCFVCGVQNPFGLRLAFDDVGAAEVGCTLSIPEYFQGYPGMAASCPRAGCSPVQFLRAESMLKSSGSSCCALSTCFSTGEKSLTL